MRNSKNFHLILKKQKIDFLTNFEVNCPLNKQTFVYNISYSFYKVPIVGKNLWKWFIFFLEAETISKIQLFIYIIISLVSTGAD